MSLVPNPMGLLNVGVYFDEDYPFEDWGFPQYHSDGAACFDLRALTNEGWVSEFRGGSSTRIDEVQAQGESTIQKTFSGAVTYRTGIHVVVPEGHVMLIFSRSGHGFKNGVRLANCTGVIDSDFRGEILVRLQNDTTSFFKVKRGDRIAQAMLLPLPKVNFQKLDALPDDTVRGQNGFGSTGK